MASANQENVTGPSEQSLQVILQRKSDIRFSFRFFFQGGRAGVLPRGIEVLSIGPVIEKDDLV